MRTPPSVEAARRLREALAFWTPERWSDCAPARDADGRVVDPSSPAAVAWSVDGLFERFDLRLRGRPDQMDIDHALQLETEYRVGSYMRPARLAQMFGREAVLRVLTGALGRLETSDVFSHRP